MCGASEATARRRGQACPELANEAVTPWLAEAAMDDPNHDLIEQAALQAAEQGGFDYVWRIRTVRQESPTSITAYYARVVLTIAGRDETDADS